MASDGFIEVPGTEGGLLKKILREGTGDEHPESGNQVSVHYVGTLTATSEKFDSSRDRYAFGGGLRCRAHTGRRNTQPT